MSVAALASAPVRQLEPTPKLTPVAPARRSYLEDNPALGTMPETSPTNVFDRVALNATRTEKFNDVDDWRSGPDQPLPEGIAAPDRFAATLAAQAVEVLLGHRPARQLQSWMSPGVFESLARRAGLGLRILGKAPATKRPHVRRASVCHPRRRVAEVTLVLHDGLRIRAAAVRLEIRHQHWYATALEIA